MATYPLLFHFKDFMAGHGWVAWIETRGRALLIEEEDGVWMHGVNPGGMAAVGVDHHDVLRNFRKAYQALLMDEAVLSESLAAFKGEITRFFEQETDLDEWELAVADVRGSNTEVDWVRTGDADRGVSIVIHAVSDMQEVDPGINADPFECEVELAQRLAA